MDDEECCCACCIVGVIFLAANNVHVQIGDKGNSGLEQAVVQEFKEDGTKKPFLLRKIEQYQAETGPALKAALGTQNICRYTPTCSEYGKQAVEKYGQFKGGLLTAKRLAKCNPLSKGGYDPVA